MLWNDIKNIFAARVLLLSRTMGNYYYCRLMGGCLPFDRNAKS
jgi:hypothetical protein